MRLPARLGALAGKFDRLTLRERLFIVVALIALLVAGFNTMLFGRLDLRRTQLSQQLDGLQKGGGSGAAAAAAYEQAATLEQHLATVNAQLSSASAGMIAPQRMAEVIHDVLSRQHGVTLLSLRNLDAIKVPLDAAGESAAVAGAPRPYVHTVEIVLEGRYLDVLAYLQALEALPWRFYWRRLELTTTHYPLNRVRVELGTVSMDSQWIGL
jgi:MSHA biogenesis protein MshJ